MRRQVMRAVLRLPANRVGPSVASTGVSPSSSAMRTHRQEDFAGVDVILDAGDELPGADERFAKRADRAALVYDGAAIGKIHGDALPVGRP
jgi:hypothetical protein